MERGRKRAAGLAERFFAPLKNTHYLAVLTAIPEQTFVGVNDAFAQRFGYRPEQLIGHTSVGLGIQRERRQQEEAVRAVVEGRARPRAVRHLYTQSNDPIDATVDMISVDLDGSPYVLSFIDVTSDAGHVDEVAAALAYERQRLAQELHDGLGQVLVALALHAKAGANSARTRQKHGRSDYAKISRMARSALEDCRRIARGLSPLQNASDLPDALNAICRTMPRRSVSYTKILEKTIQVDLRVANGLYRIAQQALSNAVTHSGATKIDVRLEVTDRELLIQIEDNGRGFRARDTYAGGTGLRNLAQRASEIGARLTLCAKPGDGIRLDCRYTQAGASPTSAGTEKALEF